MSSPYGKWRTGSKPKDNDHHGGQDYARGLGKVGDAHKYHMYAQTDSTITQETFMSVVFQRRGIPDRIAHLHLNHDSREGAVGRVLQGTKLANPLQYGTAFKSVGEVIGRLSGRSDTGTVEKAYDTHEHIEYHVLARDPRVGVRILSKNGNAVKGNTTHFRTKDLSKGMTLRQISPTPYLAHDTPLQGGIAGFASAYVGNTAFTYYNALYRTQLPAGLFAPATMGTPSKQGSFVAGKGLPVTLFNGSAYAGMDISLNALGDINSAILGDTVAFESAGFELGGGTYVTQRMLASHFGDDNGESWTSVFGNADSATVSEMSEQELVAYIANKRYANDEWRSGLVKLSTKGLLTEYLNAKAETNYLLEKIAEQEMKLMAQEALLARVRMNHKDKELESLTEAINVGVAPDFIKAELEKKGDEWIESEVEAGMELGNSPTFTGEPIDMANLPDDVMKLVDILLDLISQHESKSWDGYNTGFYSGMPCKMRGFSTDAQVQQALKEGGLKVTETPMGIIAQSYKYPVCPPNLKRLSANGRYQIMHDNVRKYLQKNPQYKNTPFTPEMQKKMVLEYFLLAGHAASRDLILNGAKADASKRYISSQWSSVCLPNTRSSSHKGQRCNYENSQKIYAVIDKIAEVHRNKSKK